MCDRDLKIGLSVGLVVVALLNAFAIVAGNRIAPRIERSLGLEPIEVQSVPITQSINWDQQRSASELPLGRTLPANPAARAEIKKQSNCVPCDAVNRSYTVTNSYPSYPSYPTYQPAQPKAPSVAPRVTPVATAPRKNLTLFVGTDAASQTVLHWFNSDPSLVQLKSKVNFHTYTKDNPLYQARYQASVPIEYFPAILFTDETGGHIHASYGTNLPRDPQTLYSDMATAYKLQQQVVRERQQAPAIVQEPPRFVTPLELDLQRAGGPDLLIRAADAAGDCVGPNCPDNRPGDRDRVFPIFDRDTDRAPVNPMEFFRGFGGSSESLIVIALVGVVGFLVYQRMR